ncbi:MULTISPECIES: T6SS phospholipase effector Tle1-like catalytic domain-containing protein [Escherichia]|uniref:T6SS phospholipase effector Tle1-like catalytic domain-containing protein n=1 Tax=Escherichia TaxID=561 RepID=UPI0002BB97C3|nr:MULTISPECIES: DUF2235 domain-containing protein [Escherichia]EFB2838764.1 DUF2235 domain-containing protein [Escherichia coli]EFD1056084.1 DUF2235 domain-containing protein [Escherichia coli]EHS3893454.1 DUF2235 domain-containing protein [Escherichia coli]EHS4055148.1 DUF2235 domain-containing protein [Escherichia coli]EHW6094175.1 DUF2235 domain-containing protein [Escherichia coli]
MSDFHAWEASECEHFTDVNVSEKTVICKRKPVPGITITIGMFFDGTGNNVFNIDKRLLSTCTDMDVGVKEVDAESCIHKLDMSSNEAGSYLGYYSNIHWLNKLYAIDGQVISDKTLYQQAIYIQGIGTAKDKEDSLIGMGIGEVFEGVVDKVNEGISQISDAIWRVFSSDSKVDYAIEKIQFDVFGFSRGAAAARHFSNRVKNGDKSIQQAITKGLNGRNQHGKPTGEIRFLGLFDTVCAVGSVSDLFDVHGGVNPGIELALSKDIAQKVFQIAAMHECRYNFSLNSIKEAWPELTLPGVHSDIGGGYNPNEQEYCFLTEPRGEKVKKDVINESTQIYKNIASRLLELKVVPALEYILPSGEVKMECWYNYIIDMDKQRVGTIEKHVGVGITLKRIVPNDWSKISLRVMLDAAKEAGARFKYVDPEAPDMKLPGELELLSQKAIKQGRIIRAGGIPVPFTPDELLIIGKYIHCSANWNGIKFKRVWLDGKQVRTIYGAEKMTHLIGYVNMPNKNWIRSIWNMKGEKA